jgi:hypothetical protein
MTIRLDGCVLPCRQPLRHARLHVLCPAGDGRFKGARDLIQRWQVIRQDILVWQERYRPRRNGLIRTDQQIRQIKTIYIIKIAETYPVSQLSNEEPMTDQSRQHDAAMAA